MKHICVMDALSSYTVTSDGEHALSCCKSLKQVLHVSCSKKTRNILLLAFILYWLYYYGYYPSLCARLYCYGFLSCLIYSTILGGGCKHYGVHFCSLYSTNSFDYRASRDNCNIYTDSFTMSH
jgi:hypothetical protein